MTDHTVWTEDDGEPGLFCDNYDGSGCGAPIDLPDGWEVDWR